MNIKIYQIDAFASELFSGNPAAVCPLEKYFHADAMINSPVKKTKGITQLKEVLQNWHVGFPNLEVHGDSFICEKD